MDINKILQSKTFHRSLVVLVIFVIILGSFAFGVFVGYRKAGFSYAWSENYDRNFGGPQRGLFGFEPGLSFTSGHGVSGSILSVASSSLSISGRDGVEKTVLVSSSTIVRENREDISASDLEKGETVVVLGAPNAQGQIQAELIRILPSMPPAPSSVSQ